MCVLTANVPENINTDSKTTEKKKTRTTAKHRLEQFAVIRPKRTDGNRYLSSR